MVPICVRYKEMMENAARSILAEDDEQQEVRRAKIYSGLENSHSSSLLSLPAEIRNRIWEYAGYQEDEIQITALLKLPPWLYSCKQIRKEAWRMWFMINRFHHNTYDLDFKIVNAWNALLVPEGLVPKTTNAIHASFNWGNLIASCKTVWADPSSIRIGRHSDGRGVGPLLVVVETAHEIAVMFRGSKWEDCERALENHRKAIAAFEPRWKEEQ